MTLRGRVTLAVLGSALVGLVLTVWPDASEPAPSPPAPVEAAPPPQPDHAAPPPSLPEALLAPPVGHEAQSHLTRLGRHLVRVLPQAPGGVTRLVYTLDADLSQRVWRVLERGRVALGHVVVMDTETGALLAYSSTDPEHFPPTRPYPAASLVKVATAAALLDRAPQVASHPCRYSGSPYRLTRARLDPPRRGREASLRRALATSNNQCFARWSVHVLGEAPLLDAIARFGFLRPPAPVHAAGVVSDPGDDRLALGRLGCGLDGLRITPLHAVQLAGVLAHGRRVAPHWLAGAFDSDGKPVPIPSTSPDQEVLTPELARRLRSMLVETTVRGTARRAFRTRRGRPLLAGVKVAGKTGSLDGHDPDGRYEWFVGVAPADHPRVAVATLAVQGPLYWMSASQLAAEVLKEVFCPEGVCRAENADRFAALPSVASGPVDAGGPAPAPAGR